MDADSLQLVNVKRRRINPIEKKSSLYMMVENINEMEEKLVSKRIQFPDIDAVW